MAKGSTRKRKQSSQRTPQVVWGLVLVLLALILVGGLAGGAGVGGGLIADGAYGLLGMGSVMLPLALGTAGIFLIRNKRFEASVREIISGSIGMLSLLTIL